MQIKVVPASALIDAILHARANQNGFQKALCSRLGVIHRASTFLTLTLLLHSLLNCATEKAMNSCAPGRDNESMGVKADPDLTRITVTAGQRSGQPCIRGLRVTVWDVLDMLASGMTEDEILDEYPYLERADFQAVYAYASGLDR